VWGALAEPIHEDAATAGDPPWRDNAYLAFWSSSDAVFGAVHVSTSPNAEGRRARFSLAAAGRVVEVIEPLEPGTFHSASIDFGLAGRVLVESPEVTADLQMTPQFAAVDYTDEQAFRPLVADAPMRHYQQATRVEGVAHIDGTAVSIAGAGIRDRTWGYRDESVQMVEYIAIIACFDTFFLSIIKSVGQDGDSVVDGFITDGSDPIRVTSARVTRDASGLFLRASLTATDGRERTVENVQRRGGLWVPMGVEREGPTMSAYDEFLVYTLDGARGHGVVEQGIIRRLY
jgi:hypothetical protein